MSKYNKKTTHSLKDHPDATTNYEGGLAFQMEVKEELVTRIASSLMGENKFYTSGEASDALLTNAVKKVQEFDPEFVLKTALYARREWNLRSAPLYLLNQHALSGKYVAGGRRYVKACIQRPDELTELLAHSYKARTSDPKYAGKRQSLFIKEGVRLAYNKFDAYQFAKYNREGEFTLKDGIFISHPNPNPAEKQCLFDAIVQDRLEPPETWEVYISEHGSSKENWEKIIPKMGIMGIIRNLRNFLKHGVNLDYVIELLNNPEAIRKSRQLPFRFYTAYRAIADVYYVVRPIDVIRLMDALNNAIELSISNLPKIGGRSLVLVDVSGSMDQKISEKSEASASDIACVFGAIASKICNDADVIVFGSDYEITHFPTHFKVLDRVTMMKYMNVGGATYAYKPIQAVAKEGRVYDRIIILSDMQCYTEYEYGGSFSGEFLRYQKNVYPATLYSIDLVGYGTQLVPNNNICLLGGWSEQILKFININEKGIGNLVSEIEGYSLTEDLASC